MLKIPLVNGQQLCLNPNYSPKKHSNNHIENTIERLINNISKNNCPLLSFRIIE